jgi:hypothetical protein
MWKQIKAHPVVTGFVSVCVVVGAIVAFLAGLATIWNAYSHDTVPDFLAKKGWAMTIPPWQGVLLLCVSLAILICQVAILREAYRAQLTTASRKESELPEWLASILQTDIGNSEVFLYTMRETIQNRLRLERRSHISTFGLDSSMRRSTT